MAVRIKFPAQIYRQGFNVGTTRKKQGLDWGQDLLIAAPYTHPTTARLLVFRMYANQFGNYTKLKFPYRDRAC